MKEIYIFPAVFFGALIIIFTGMWFAVHDKRYEPNEASSECAAAGKRLGTFEYSYGHSRFTCADPPWVTGEAK